MISGESAAAEAEDGSCSKRRREHYSEQDDLSLIHYFLA